MKKLLLLATIALSSCADALSGNSIEEKEKFDRIKRGMSKQTVLRILGDPEYKDSTHEDGQVYYYFFTKNKAPGRSQEPFVLFDSSGKVKFATYGDGG
jgi:outer membrane protein assembly factor BamE (lipoprotein component of BamABCDE complex)